MDKVCFFPYLGVIILRWTPDALAIEITRNFSSHHSFDWSGAIDFINSKSSSPLSCQYLGVILDEESRQRLLEQYTPIFPCVRSHHLTLSHVNDSDFLSGETKVQSEDTQIACRLGDLCEISIFGEIRDNNCQGLVAEVSTVLPIPGHITVSHDPSVTPKYTKQLVEHRAENSDATYSLRDPADPLILKGIVSICISKDRQTDLYSHPVDLFVLVQECSVDSQSRKLSLQTIKKHSRFSFDFLFHDTQKVYVFDLDDTLFQSPSPMDYKEKTGIVWKKPQSNKQTGGWYCNADSLDLSFHYPACPGINSFFDHIGELNSSLIILTGRPNELYQSVLDLLGSRGILQFVDAVVCKPTIRESTSQFKSEYLQDLCSHCPHVTRIEVWDDNSENISTIEEAFKTESKVQLVTHFVSPFESHEPEKEFIVDWAERNGHMLTQLQSQSRLESIDWLKKSWAEICRGRSLSVSSDVDPSEFIHIFGSFVFERRSDIDMVLIVPKDILGNLTHNCQWMRLLESKLLESGQQNGFQLLAYLGTTGTVPKMTLKFKYLNLPSTEIDLIGFITDSATMMNSEIKLAEAINWTVDELKLANEQPSSKLSPADFNVLYGFAVRNTCLTTIQAASLTCREFGSLISVARRLMDCAYAMGTIRCGMRPYLIAISLCRAISRLCSILSNLTDIMPQLSLSDILTSWVKLHSSSLTSFEPTIDALMELYQGNVAMTHLNRMIKTFHRVYSETQFDDSLCRSLDTLALPSQGEFKTVSILMSWSGTNQPSELEHYLATNVMYGILSKYFGRMIRDGHDIISTPTVHQICWKPAEESGEGCVGIACFGLSVNSIEVFEYLFPQICKDFEAHNKHRTLKLEIVS